MNAYASANAARLARMGRRGDTHLLHISTDELRELNQMGHLTRNPRTGLPEAFSLGGALRSITSPVTSTVSAITHPVDSIQNAVANVKTNPFGVFTGGLGGSALGTGGFDYLGRSPLQNRTGLGAIERGIGTGVAGAGAGALAGGGLGGGLVGAGTRYGINQAGGGVGGAGLNAPMQQRVPLGADASWGANPADPGGPGIVGGILGAGATGLGANEALKSYEEAQHNAEAAGRFQPWNVYSGMGNTTFGPGGATSTLNPQYQGVHDTLLKNASGQLGAAGAYDPQTASDQYYQQLQAQAQPYEAQDRANALAQLQAMGQTGLGVGGDALSGPSNPLFSSVLRAQSDAARQRQITAQTMAQQIANSTQQRGLGSLGAGLQLDQSAFQPGAFGEQLGQDQMRGQLAGASLAQPSVLAQGATKGGFLGGLGDQLKKGGLSGLTGMLPSSSTLFGPGGFSGMVGGVGNNIGSWFGGGGQPQQVGIGQDIYDAGGDPFSTGLLDPSAWDPTEGGVLGLY